MRAVKTHNRKIYSPYMLTLTITQIIIGGYQVLYTDYDISLISEERDNFIGFLLIFCTHQKQVKSRGGLTLLFFMSILGLRRSYYNIEIHLKSMIYGITTWKSQRDLWIQTFKEQRYKVFCRRRTGHSYGNPHTSAGSRKW